MARVWTCQGCRTQWPRTKQRCTCGRRRPKARQPKHQAVLAEVSYEEAVERYGERCGICKRPPSSTRRLDRDHDHHTHELRGLLCVRCNRALPAWVTVKWLLDAARYLDR